MDIVIILQIITMGISLFTLIFNAGITKKENKKTKKKKIDKKKKKKKKKTLV